MAKPPVRKFSSHANPAVQVCIWQNENGHFYLTLKKSFKRKGTDVWETTEFYEQRDIETLALLLPRALSWIDAMKDKERGKKPPPEPIPLEVPAPMFDDKDIPF